MTAPLAHSRPNTFEIDLGAIAANVDELRRFVGPDVRIFVAMKANAYGFGVVEVGSVLQESGADALCVADILDAARLRAAGITLPILLYAGSHVDAAFVREVERLGLWATIADVDDARRLSAAARERVSAFVKVDVGLERLGVPVDRAREALAEVTQLPGLRLEGMYTHLHVPDRIDGAGYVDWQIDRFRRLVEDARGSGIALPLVMAASTPIVPGLGAAGFDGIDVGRLVYGSLRGRRNEHGPLRIRNAFKSLSSRLAQVKLITRTEHLDDAPFPLRPGMRIGIAPIGYADGIEALNCGHALVCGRRVPLLGSPSLEHTRLDLTDVPSATVGDEVVFIGTQGDNQITPDDVLEHLALEQPARIATAVRGSVTRVYIRSAR